jgi:hypothetical protein
MNHPTETIYLPDGSRLEVDAKQYQAMVADLERRGYTTSDAQGAVDCYFMQLHLTKDMAVSKKEKE